jgi:hypothetical protein
MVRSGIGIVTNVHQVLALPSDTFRFEYAGSSKKSTKLAISQPDDFDAAPFLGSMV